MALLKESTVTKPVTYTLRRSVGGYRVLYGGDDVGRTVADACAKSPMRRSPLERAVVAMAFGAN
jgi:hypothetical protein